MTEKTLPVSAAPALAPGPQSTTNTETDPISNWVTSRLIGAVQQAKKPKK